MTAANDELAFNESIISSEELETLLKKALKCDSISFYTHHDTRQVLMVVTDTNRPKIPAVVPMDNVMTAIHKFFELQK